MDHGTRGLEALLQAGGALHCPVKEGMRFST